MTINIEELRRLAQAATPGPWGNTDTDPTVINSPYNQLAICYRNSRATTDAKFIAAANPTAVSELLDRLEAAEKERDDVAQQLVQSEQGKRKISEECDALRAEVIRIKEVEFPRKAQAVADGWRGKLEAAEKERDAAELMSLALRAENAALIDDMNLLRNNNMALRAKITEMERQRPVGKFIRHPSNGLWEQDGYGDNPDARPLYALPGAKGEEK